MRLSLARRLVALVVLPLIVAMSALWSATPSAAQRGATPTPPSPQIASLSPYHPRPISVAPAAQLQAAAQGTTQVFPAVADAEVREGSPAAPLGITGTLGVGYANIASEPDFSGKIHRALLDFDLATYLPPGTTIHQAQLQLSLAGYCDYFPTSLLSVYRVSEPWTELGVTWATQPAFAESYGATSVPMPPLNPSDPPFIVGFDVTALAQAWVAGQQPEYGLMLRGPETTRYDCAFRSFLSKGGGGFTEAPRLVVDYTLPAPALLAPDGDQQLARDACGETPAPRAVRLASNQATLSQWTVSVSGGEGWLTASVGRGRVSRVFPDQLTLAVAPGAACDGDHQAQVTLQAPGLAPASFRVTLSNGTPARLPVRALLPMVVTRPGGGALAADPMGAWLTPAAATPTRVAILIGVSDYKHLEAPSTFSLFRAGDWGEDINAGHVDVYAIRSELQRLGGFQQIIYLPGSYGSAENIREAFTVVHSYDSADMALLLYNSGHGAQTSESDLSPPDELDHLDELIAPYDANQTDEGFTNVWLDDDLSAELDSLQSQNVGVILDTCFSGGMELGRPEHALLAASTESQSSWESSRLEHGVMTSSILEAMQKPANDLDYDGWISLSELHAAVRSKVASYVKQNLNKSQTPVARIDPEHDFLLVKLPPAVAAR